MLLPMVLVFHTLLNAPTINTFEKQLEYWTDYMYYARYVSFNRQFALYSAIYANTLLILFEILLSVFNLIIDSIIDSISYVGYTIYDSIDSVPYGLTWLDLFH